MAAMTGGVADRMRAGPRSWRGWLMGWRLWLWWVLASTVGWAVGGTVGEAVGGGLSRDINVAGYVSVAVGGIAAGALQWLVLRRQVARAGWWVVTGIVGGAVVGVGVGVVGWVVSWVRGVVGGADWGVGVVLFGPVVGALQWLVLRRQVAWAGWWVLASAVGWVVGGLMAGIAAGVVGWVVAGAVYGAITGPVLVWLLRQPVPAAATEE